MALGILLAGSQGGASSAGQDSKPGDGPEPKTPAGEARALVESLEARVKQAQEDLERVRGLLPTIEEGRKPADERRSPETGDLEGVWRIAGIGGNRERGTFVKPPYDEYKIMISGHHLWLSFNRDTGEILRSGGGTYSLKDGNDKARVDYSNAPTSKRSSARTTAGPVTWRERSATITAPCRMGPSSMNSGNASTDPGPSGRTEIILLCNREVADRRWLIDGRGPLRPAIVGPTSAATGAAGAGWALQPDRPASPRGDRR